MRTYLYFVCQICGKRAFRKEQIDLCEARHLGLETAQQKRYYSKLIDKYNLYRQSWKKKPRKATQNQMLKISNKIKKFEQEHNIKKHILYNNYYVDKIYIQELKNILGE